MNITQTINNFKAVADFTRDGEVELFRHLANSIVAHGNGVFIDETHGNVAQVSFTSPINGPDKCEISDLLIVMKLRDVDLYRATFWQAKKEAHPRWPLLGNAGNFDFEAQFNQWELLSLRLGIHGTSPRFNPPRNLLSGASSPSIGSFGVFHMRGDDIEVNYSVAEVVCSSSVSLHPRMIVNNYLARYYAWNQEVLVRSDLRSFLKAINDFTIGAWIDPASTSGNWLFSYIEGKSGAHGKKSFIDKSFASGIINDAYMDRYEDGDGISILMIEVGHD